MKPVAILRHAALEGPGYLGTYLTRRGIPWTVVEIDRGEPVPPRPDPWAGLVLMGGPMSVNDDLPWIRAELDLVRRAVDAGTPTLGHCLGGQLMAKALGGTVTRSPVREIGWDRVDVLEAAAAKRWFGEGVRSFECFHWHGETFSIPPGATRVLSSAHCENQGFVTGPHLALQCHVEMTADLVRSWCGEWDAEVDLLSRRLPSVQAPAQMTEALDERVRALHAVADRIYGRWTEGLGG